LQPRLVGILDPAARANVLDSNLGPISIEAFGHTAQQIQLRLYLRPEVLYIHQLALQRGIATMKLVGYIASDFHEFHNVYPHFASLPPVKGVQPERLVNSCY